MLLFLLLQAAAPAVPADWSTLPFLPASMSPQVTPPLTRFVADEVAAGRCVQPRPADGHYVLKVEVAALIGTDGSIRRSLPRAIDCATVEQYSAGLVVSFARTNPQPHAGTTEAWYRTTIVYDWRG